METAPRILFIDDNPKDRNMVVGELRRLCPNLLLVQITDAESLQQALQGGEIDLVITEYQLRWSDGITVLKSIHSIYPSCPVVMFTASGSEEIAVAGMKAGLEDYISKSPQNLTRLSTAVRTILDTPTIPHIVKETPRKEIEEALRQSEERFRGFIESIDDIIWEIDQAGLVTYVSPKIYDVLGYRPEEVIGKSADDLGMESEIQLLHEMLAQKQLEDGKTILLESKYIHKGDQHRVVLETSAVPIRDSLGNIRGYRGAFRNVTERKKADWKLTQTIEALKRREAILKAIGLSSGLLLKTALWRDCIPAVLSHLGQATEVSRVYLFENHFLEGQPATTSQIFEWTDGQATPEMENPLLQNVSLEGPGFSRHTAAFKDRQILVRSVLDFNEEERQRMEPQGVQSILAVPIFVNEIWWGFIGFDDCRQVRDWSEGEIEALKTATDLLSAAIQRRQSEEALATAHRLREHEMEAVIKISAVLRSLSRRSEILPVILSLTMEQLDAKAALLVLSNPVTDNLVFELGLGEWSQATGAVLGRDEGINGLVIHTGQPYFNSDIRSDPRLARPELLSGISSVACVPLIAQKQTIGALWVGCDSPLPEQEQRLLMAIGEIAANAINRTTLNEQTELHLQRLTALRAIDIAITSSLDVRVTLNILLSQVTGQLGVHAAGIMLLNAYTQTLEYTAVRGFRSNTIQQIRQRLGEGHAGKVAVDRQPVVIPDLRKDQGCYGKKQVESEGFIAYFATPLIAKGQVRGVLEIFHRAPLTPDPEWNDFLQAISAQAAIAIDNAELFDKLQRSNLDLTLAYDETIAGWARAMEMRDRADEGHMQQLIDLTLRLGRAYGLPEADLVHVRRGVLLHDIGIISIPDQILYKPDPLTTEEWEVMRRHPGYAFDLLSPISYLRPAIDIPYCHHEKWDGSGYPRGLSGQLIPLFARIYSVVDVWDALISDRPYRTAWTRDLALEYIRSQSSLQFDPEIVQLFLAVLPALNR